MRPLTSTIRTMCSYRFEAKALLTTQVMFATLRTRSCTWHILTVQLRRCENPTARSDVFVFQASQRACLNGSYCVDVPMTRRLVDRINCTSSISGACTRIWPMRSILCFLQLARPAIVSHPRTFLPQCLSHVLVGQTPYGINLWDANRSYHFHRGTQVSK